MRPNDYFAAVKTVCDVSDKQSKFTHNKQQTIEFDIIYPETAHTIMKSPLKRFSRTSQNCTATAKGHITGNHDHMGFIHFN